MKSLRNVAPAFIVVIAVGSWASPARADFLASASVEITPSAGGWLRYEYTVAVDAAGTRPLFQFDLGVASDADLEAIEAQAGWSFDYDAAGGAISFFADAPTAPVAPGSSAVFAFLSRLRPVEMEYYLVGEGSPVPSVIPGVIAAPGAAVPEPSSFALLFAAAGAGLAGARRARP